MRVIPFSLLVLLVMSGCGSKRQSDANSDGTSAYGTIALPVPTEAPASVMPVSHPIPHPILDRFDLDNATPSFEPLRVRPVPEVRPRGDEYQYDTYTPPNTGGASFRLFFSKPPQMARF